MMPARDSWTLPLFHQGNKSKKLMHTPLCKGNKLTFKHSNTKKVVRKKVDGEWKYEVVHWKTDTVQELYERCCLQSPIVANCKVKYFAKFIPWYVRQKPNYSGLCWKHDVGIFFANLLKTRRTRWHLDCECDCIFCAECDHGKNPDQGECHYGTCKRCMSSECPIEYNDDEQGI